MAKIKSITRKKITTERLYNLAVEEDETYIANGVIVHNCRSVLIPITVYEEFEPDTHVGKTPMDDFIEEKKGAGFPKQ